MDTANRMKQRKAVTFASRRSSSGAGSAMSSELRRTDMPGSDREGSPPETIIQPQVKHAKRGSSRQGYI